MNGRVYDPSIGRFLSADKQVPYITHTQSFNRYSYVQNNPLSRVDPSGYGDIGSYDANAEKKKKQPPPCAAGEVRNSNGDCVVPPECDEQCEEDNRKAKQKARANYRKAQRFCSRDVNSDACKNNFAGYVSAEQDVTFRHLNLEKGEPILDANGNPLTITNRSEGKWFNPNSADVGGLIDSLVELRKLRKFFPFPIRDVQLRRVDIIQTSYYEELIVPEVMRFNMKSALSTARSFGKLRSEAYTNGNVISEAVTIRSFYEARVQYLFSYGNPIYFREIKK